MTDETPINPMRLRSPAEFFPEGLPRRAAAAIKDGDTRTLEALLAAEPSLAKYVGTGGMTMALWATSLQEPDALSLLLRAGEDPNRMIVMGRQKFQLLALAAGGDNDLVFSVLLAAGADPNSVDNGEPALFNAIHARRWSRVDALLKAGADIDAPGQTGSPPVIYLAKINEYAAVEDFIARGADVRAKDRGGLTLADYVQRFPLSADSPNGQAHARIKRFLVMRGQLPPDA